jgi:anaerobic ribonucleoside-triphosphate reductase activating protein
MGGDKEPKEVEKLTTYVRQNHPEIKVEWYSGKESISEEINPESFDFIKIGPYIEERGGLDKEGTNQVFYRVNKGGDLEDITERFKPRF